MKRLYLLFCWSLLSSTAFAAITGRVVDPAGAGVSGARLVLANRLGVLEETASNPAGHFRLDGAASARGAEIVVTAPGFARRTLPLDSAAGQPIEIRLEIAPVSDSITVSASVIAAPLSEQGSSVTVIPRAEIEQRNEASAADLLRFVPGVVLNQTGRRGGAASLFIRGGEASYNLIMIDGVP